MNPADNVLVIAGVSVPLSAADTNVIFDSIDNSLECGTDYEALQKRLKSVREEWEKTPEFKAEEAKYAE